MVGTNSSPRAWVRRIYGDKNGYLLDRAEVKAIEAAQSKATYGELMPAATEKLSAHLRLGPRDVFFDLGSGIGKLALMIALASKVGRVVGCELAPSRHRIAVEARASALAMGLKRANCLELRQDNLITTDLSGTTVAYACSTSYPGLLMNRLVERLAKLPRGLRFVTLRDLDPNPYFQHSETLRLDTSWRRRTNVHVYELVKNDTST